MIVDIKAGDVFRVLTDIMSIHSFDGRMVALVIRNGSFIKVVAHPCGQHNRMTEVLCDEQPIHIFSRDLKERALQLSISANESRLNAQIARLQPERQAWTPEGKRTGRAGCVETGAKRNDLECAPLAGFVLPQPSGVSLESTSRQGNAEARAQKAINAEVYAFMVRQVEVTKSAYDEARRGFWDIAVKPCEWPTGRLPFPDGSDLFRRRMAQEKFMMKSHTAAVTRLNLFLWDETIPEDMLVRPGRKAKRESPVSSVKTTVQIH